MDHPVLSALYCLDSHREVSDGLLGGVQVGLGDGGDVDGLNGLVGKTQGLHDLVLVLDKQSSDHSNQS